MEAISITDVRNLFTKKLVAVFDERVQTLDFGRSFFPSITSNSKQISWQVRRTSEKVAEEQTRGTLGQRNTVSKSTEKLAIPPYYEEYFDATEMGIYDRLFGTDGNIDVGAFTEFNKEVSRELGLLQDKILRSKELQCWQVLLTGIVIAKAGNFDFRRKVASLIDLGGGNFWDNNAVDPRAVMQSGGEFLRNTGKVQDNTFDMILGRDSYSQLINNDIFKSSMDVRRITLGEITRPQAMATGARLMGQVTAGEYIFNIWVYSEVFDTKSSTANRYMDVKDMIILPEKPEFVFSHAQVPMLPDSGLKAEGEFFVSDHLDPRKKTHEFVIESTGLAIPVGVDQVFTATVAA